MKFPFCALRPYSWLAASLMLLGSQAVHGASLLGTKVTGNLVFPNENANNYFDPTNGYVPATTSNTAGTMVTIADPNVEFGFQNTSFGNLLTANFSSNTLTLLDTFTPPNAQDEFVLTFTDPVFSTFSSLTLTSNNFPGLTYTLAGNTLTINEPINSQAANAATFTFNSTSAVPDSGTTAFLLGVGVVCLGVFRRISAGQGCRFPVAG